MKELMKTNIYDVEKTIVVIGSCLPSMQPDAYKELEKIIFASVDKSPHCIQLHYVQNELKGMINLKNIQIENYVAVNNKLEKIDEDIISLSKNFVKLKELANK